MINWLGAVNAGVAAGIAMGLWLALIHVYGLTRMDVPLYEGCLVIGVPSSMGTFISGVTLHMIVAVVMAFVYAWLFNAVWGQSGIVQGLMIGIVHWLIVGAAIPVTDRLNHCVRHGAMSAGKAYMRGYGSAAVLTFLIGHLLYGAVMGLLYRLPPVLI